MIPRQRRYPFHSRKLVLQSRVLRTDAYLVSTKANHSSQLDIRSKNRMCIVPDPHAELRFVRRQNVPQERFVLKFVHGKPRSVHSKSTGLWLIHRARDIGPTLAVHTVGNNDDIGHRFLVVKIDAGAGGVVEDFSDARPEGDFDANGDGVVVHNALCAPSVAVQVRETIEFFWEILVNDYLAVLVLAAEERR
jgi:hypothetical protein